ncbi:MAG: N-acetyltransferase [Hyphomicrobiales bacterium]
MVHIREENVRDVEARDVLLDEAFGDCRFRKTSERLREDRLPAAGLSLVAVTAGGRDEAAGRLVGTVRLWNVTAGPRRPALLLGPLAVAEEHRGRGVGGRLMTAALERARALGHRAVLLVGDAPYYGRFGFTAEATGDLWLPGPVERERFLGLELEHASLAGARGLVSPTGRPVPKPDLAALVAAMAQDGRFQPVPRAA